MGRPWRWLRSCPELAPRCTFSKNRSLEADASALLFHALDAFEGMPQDRQPHQRSGLSCSGSHEPIRNAAIWNRYVWYMLESAGNYPSSRVGLEPNFFNWTMTYRRDSDIHWPYWLTLDRESNLQPNCLHYDGAHWTGQT